MIKNTCLSCYLIGEDTLIIQCADILLTQGFKVLGIISPLSAVEEWALKNEVPSFTTLKEAEKILLSTQFDYLFSIVNTEVLSSEILNKPRQFAINYHDSPLPRYAGIHATCWAILNHEKKHAVTWHIINDIIDGGDILKQSSIEIDEKETAFSLNLKCYQQAIKAFEELAFELANNSYYRSAQDLTKRTYYGISKKPIGNGWVNWNSSAEEIDILYRALDLDHYSNRLSVPKFKINNEVFILNEMQILNERSEKSPGTLIELAEDYLRIATLTQDILLLKISTIEGHNYPLNLLAKHYCLAQGSSLYIPTATQLEQLAKISISYAKEEAFWVKELAHFKPANLPFFCLETFHEKRIVLSHVQTFQLPTFLYQRLKHSFAQEYDFSIILLTAWLIYLYRLGNRDNLGIALHYQGLSQIPKDIAPFIANLIPSSFYLEDNMHFEHALKLVRDQYINLGNRASYVKDVFYRYPILSDRTKMTPIAIIITDQNHREICKTDLKAGFALVISNDGTQISCLMDSNLIQSESCLSTVVNNIPGHFLTLLEAIAQNERKSIAELTLLTQAERQIILFDWNNTVIDYPKNKLLHQLFEESVIKTPDHIAVSYKGCSLTYTELNQKSNQLAHYLCKLKVEPGKIVAIYMDRSLEMIISILGVLKTGAAYVPVAPNFPIEHIRSILADSIPIVMLTNKKVTKEIENICVDNLFIPLIHLTNAWNLIQQCPSENPSLSFNSDNVAYIIYTSGTTGKPKGVIIKHRGVINLVMEEIRRLNISAESRVLQFASLSFDASVWEIFPALAAGATLLIPSQEQILTGHLLSAFIEYEKIDILTVPPSMLYTLDPDKLNSVKVIVTAGESCPLELAKTWVDKNFLLINAYGPTETTVCATMAYIRSNINSKPNIGKPIANMQTYVLDHNLNPVPVGVVGELYIGGDGLAAGYLNQSQLTQEKFIPDVFHRDKQRKLYKTGDLACWLSDGNLDYIGRRDTQIKIRGFRVELEAIESHLLHHDSIKQCTVIAYDDKRGNKYLVGYLVGKDNVSVDFTSLKQFLRTRLPEYMVPALFVDMKTLPLTSNGKIDRRSLPAPDINRRFIDTPYVPPRTTEEERLVKIWSDILGIDKIGIYDDFFSLGGYSLLITKLILNLSKNFNYNLILNDFLEAPTIAHLSTLLSNNPKVADKTDSVMIEDMVLNPDIQLLSFKKEINVSSFLITGATGFLGAHLLYDLYRLTNAKIYCLLRCETIDQGISQLRAALNRYGLKIDLTDRIIPLQGDLSKPNLGLSPELFLTLSEKIDVIYHNGAYVHHLYNYKTLRPANVLSTVELLKLAVLGKHKSFNYISTLSAVSGHTDEHGSIIEDFISSDDISCYRMNGYNQTKWISERLLAQAKDRGINVKIFRPGWIMGQSGSGIVSYENNHLLQLIKGCIQLGHAPAWNSRLNILPVDFISRFVIDMSLNDQMKSTVFNLVNPNFVTWIELIDHLKAHGFSISLISSDIWRKKYIPNITPNNALFSLLSFYINQDDLSYIKNMNQMSQASISNTTNGIKEIQLPFPQMNEELLKKYITFLCTEGFLELVPKINRLAV